MSKFTFRRWFFHWCSYQVVANRLGIWRARYLFHDLDKPFMALFFNDDKVRRFHKRFSRHHLFHGPADLNAVIIDWECSSLSKPDALLNARQTYERYFRDEMDSIDREFFERRLDSFGL